MKAFDSNIIEMRPPPPATVCISDILVSFM